ncbi:MAG: hypothetical protein WBG92_06355 [Thiohalocapsa sp.]
MAKLIKGQVEAEAKQRQSKAGGNVSQKSNASVPRDGTENQDPPSANESRQQIAKAVGMGKRQLKQASDVVEHRTPELVEGMAKPLR